MFSRGYLEYRERHEYEAYRNTPLLSQEQFVVVQEEWDAKYDKLWVQVNKYLDEHGYTLEFSKAPAWPEIKRLEALMCV